MAVGEFISVSSQRDAEAADIQREREEQAKGPEAQQKELRELAGVPITPCCMLQNAVCRSANFLCPLRSAWPAGYRHGRPLQPMEGGHLIGNRFCCGSRRVSPRTTASQFHTEN
mmetsp:Transcript_319/g.919  ORF Transcript_319/g.919 Transcript_319/m.919 type:complete len:114 (-) Transcript_319:349-690(-)